MRATGIGRMNSCPRRGKARRPSRRKRKRILLLSIRFIISPSTSYGPKSGARRLGRLIRRKVAKLHRHLTFVRSMKVRWNTMCAELERAKLLRPAFDAYVDDLTKNLTGKHGRWRVRASESGKCRTRIGSSWTNSLRLSRFLNSVRSNSPRSRFPQLAKFSRCTSSWR
ncbi:hypothetical protein B0H17DRAFT_168823 [Mycena rosella]|uniref:Uncharacterized protein n=1 Tax=Mycena rosella TaxID=1033263 RepID=A0AAD7G6Z8_MYCRO|nr:hypothetical protein B0H17DRAFT_168823 [Mycena rosella]